MTLAQLESDLRAANEKTSTLIADAGQKANAENRVWTDEERVAIKGSIAEAEAIHKRIEQLRGDQELVTRLDKLTGSVGRPTSSGLIVPRTNLTIGAQFVQSAEFQTLIRSGLHRRGSAWSSGAVECTDPFLQMMRATTLTEDPASGGKLIAPQYLPGIVPLNYKRLMMASILASGTTDSNA